MTAPMFSVTMDPKGAKRLLDLYRRFPRETYKGIGRAGSTIRSKLRKVMKVGGGIEGVPKFAPFDSLTGQLRTALTWMNRKEGTKLGGVLSRPSSIQMYRNGKGRLTIGFLSVLDPYARMFQESQTRALTQGERNFYRVAFYATGNKALKDARTYSRPGRPVIDPFARRASLDLTRWAIRNTEKIIEKAAAS